MAEVTAFRISDCYDFRVLALWLLTLLWAVTATVMLFRNPFPVPDRRHRLFGVPDELANRAVVEILSRAGIPLRFRFKTGPTLQSLLWDNQTVIHVVDSSIAGPSGLNGNGISLPVPTGDRPTAVGVFCSQGD